MSADLVMVQESVKLALDAADAAADVTAEYNKVKKENNVAKHNEEKPTNEIIYNLFSIGYFFPIPLLLKQAYNFHHVLHKRLMR